MSGEIDPTRAAQSDKLSAHTDVKFANGVDNEDQPFPVTLVIPVRNEEESLRTLIDGIAQQRLPPHEIIIVNGGSSDGTLKLAQRLTAHDTRFKILDAGDGTPGRNRNVGAAAASHDWVAFTDAGTRPEPAWLEEMVKSARADASAKVVWGSYEVVEDTFFEHCAGLSYPPPKQLRAGGMMRGPSTASMMIRRETFNAVGGMPDLRASEDLAFFEELERARIRVTWAPRAKVWWLLQPNFVRTFHKFVLYSRHNVWAGRQWQWHYGVARQYAIVFAFVVLGIAHSRWWFFGVLAWLGARVFRNIWRRRDGRGLLWTLNPARLLGVGAILLTIDLATFVGWAQAKIAKA